MGGLAAAVPGGYVGLALVALVALVAGGVWVASLCSPRWRRRQAKIRARDRMWADIQALRNARRQDRSE
jgi:hypothetical protein